MGIQRSAAAAAVFAAVLLAGACSSSTKSTTAAAPAPSTPAAAPVTVTSTVTSAPATASASSAGGAPSTAASSAAGSSSAPSASGSACQGTNLKVTIVHGTDADPDPAKSGTAAVVSITNTGQSTCTVQGHPQVDLISTAGVDWPLVPQAGDTPKLTLAPGTSALASLYLLSHSTAGGEAFQVESAVITPPDTKTQTTVAWPWNWALERQDAATHPGTFIGAVNQTASS